MKHYLLSVVQPVGDPPPPEELEPIMRNIENLHAEIKAAGRWVFAGGLYPQENASVVRVRHGDVLVTDGPFAETKEGLGGLLIIKAADLDEALAWGRKAAAAVTLPIEIRPSKGLRASGCAAKWH